MESKKFPKKHTLPISSINLCEAVLWQLPNFVIYKDTNSTYLGCNQNFAKLAGYTSLDAIVGIKDEELRCEASESAVLFRKQDKDSMLYKPQVILDIHRFADDKIWTCLSHKTPLKDHAGQIIGCINQMSEINIPLLTKLGLNLIKGNIKKYNHKINSLVLSHNGNKQYKLTKRESECLFYILRGKTMKETAKCLKISPKTVEDYFEQLKYKFSSQTKSELIGKAIEEGFLNIIPASMLPSNLSQAVSFSD